MQHATTYSLSTAFRSPVKNRANPVQTELEDSLVQAPLAGEQIYIVHPNIMLD